MAGNSATIDGVVIKNAATVAWAITPGTSPYFTSVVVDVDALSNPGNMLGRPVTLAVSGMSGKWSVSGVYVVDYQQGPTPFDWTLVLADRRWLWPRTHVRRRYNVRRRTGSMRFLTEGIPTTVPVSVSDYFYEFATLKGGTELWTGVTTLEDVVQQVDGTKPDLSGIPTRTVPIVGIELDDSGDHAIDRLRASAPGCNLYVDLGGVVRFFDETDLAASQRILQTLGPPTVGSGLANLNVYAGIRPSAINVLFTPEQELKLDRKSTRLNSSHSDRSRMPSSA